DGATWTFPQHTLQAPVTALAGSGAGLWVTNSKNRVVLASGDQGATWSFPSGATVSRGWGASQKYTFGGSVRGSTLAVNPVYKSTLYCALGSTIVRSRNDGDTWSVAANFPSPYSRCNA